MSCRCAHVHLHTSLSFQDGYGRPEQVISRAVELGHTHCAVTDHGNVFAHVMFQKEARKAGITPVFGCEFYVVDNMRDRTKEIKVTGTTGIPHVTVLARNQQGYEHLLKLSRLSWEEGFYYKPRVDWDELALYQEGLIVLSGCPGGYPTRIMLEKGEEACHRWIANMRHRFEHFYVELNPSPAYKESCPTVYKLWKIAKDLGIPSVLTSDAHFPRPENHVAQDLMLCVGLGKKLADAQQNFRIPDYQYMCTAQELFDRTVEALMEPSGDSDTMMDDEIWQAIDNSQAVAEMCQVEIPKAKRVAFPGADVAGGADAMLQRWAWEGFQQKWGAGKLMLEDGRMMRDVDFTRENVDLNVVCQRYWSRAMHELSVLRDKGFCDYMLAIIDVVRWVKAQNVLVMTRGSAGGCLLLWLCGASETDPLRFGLSFERFYDHTRPNPPDIDVDFEQSFRAQAIQYVYDKYGHDCCSQLAALSQLKAKAALQDVCFALGISRYEYGPLADALDSNDDDVDRQLEDIKDARALAVLTKYPELRELVPQLIGQYRQQSIHAAGVLVSAEPLDKVIGIVLTADKQPVAAVDKKGAEALDLLKMDFLSVSSLDVVADAVRSLGLPVSFLYDLPLDDKAALEVGDVGLLAGIFQLDGASAARVSKRIGIHDFEDVVAASALCRPGPGDWVEIYRQNKSDWHKFAMYLGQFNDRAAQVVKLTYGILLYQEQVMQLARNLAGFEWAEVHKLRKGVQDKLGLDPQTGPAWRAEWSKKFIDGCQWNAVSPAEAMHWWQSVETHGGYSFNRSHCVTYAIIGYWMLWLKAHHPAAFYESYLKLEADPVKAKRLITEFQAIGGKLELLRPDKLTYSFSSPEPGVLAGGLVNLRGCGPVTARKILERGPFHTWDELLQELPKQTREKLEYAGVLTDQWDPQALIDLAPWFPVPALGPAEAPIRQVYGERITPIRKLCQEFGGQECDGVMICGYITVKGKHKDRTILLVEDETGPMTIRVSRWEEKEGGLGSKLRGLRVGDFAIFMGWWSGSTLFVKDFGPFARGGPAYEQQPTVD